MLLLAVVSLAVHLVFSDALRAFLAEASRLAGKLSG